MLGTTYKVCVVFVNDRHAPISRCDSHGCAFPHELACLLTESGILGQICREDTNGS
jgi:hypothetical protein